MSASANGNLCFWDLSRGLVCVSLLSSAPRIRKIWFSFSLSIGQRTLLCCLHPSGTQQHPDVLGPRALLGIQTYGLLLL